MTIGSNPHWVKVSTAPFTKSGLMIEAGERIATLSLLARDIMGGWD
jgi:hypothetical protein